MSKPAGYTLFQITLHWLIGLLFLFQFLTGDAMGEVWDKVEKGGDAASTPHVWAGVTILILAIIRIAIKVQRGSPELPADQPAWQKMAAHATHGILYLLMLVIPLSGMAAWFMGLKISAEFHEAMTGVFLFVFAVHFVGALYHRFVLKSGVMERMLKPAK